MKNQNNMEFMFIIAIIICIAYLIVIKLQIKKIQRKYQTASDLVTQMSCHDPIGEFNKETQDQHYFKVIALSEDAVLLELLGDKMSSSDQNLKIWYKKTALPGAHFRSLISIGKTFQIFFNVSLPDKFYNFYFRFC